MSEKNNSKSVYINDTCSSNIIHTHLFTHCATCVGNGKIRCGACKGVGTFQNSNKESNRCNVCNPLEQESKSNLQLVLGPGTVACNFCKGSAYVKIEYTTQGPHEAQHEILNAGQTCIHCKQATRL